MEESIYYKTFWTVFKWPKSIDLATSYSYNSGGHEEIYFKTSSNFSKLLLTPSKLFQTLSRLVQTLFKCIQTSLLPDRRFATMWRYNFDHAFQGAVKAYTEHQKLLDFWILSTKLCLSNALFQENSLFLNSSFMS